MIDKHILKVKANWWKVLEKMALVRRLHAYCNESRVNSFIKKNTFERPL